MNPIAPILICFLATVQDGSPERRPESVEADKPVESDKSEEQPFDHVYMIVNQDMVTARELGRELLRLNRERPVKNQMELERLKSQLVDKSLLRMLAAQAGQDLGASEEIVRILVDREFERMIRAKGGIVGATKFLQARDQTTQEYRQLLREELFAKTWEEFTTGEGPGVGARPQRDRYVRPGQLKFRYNVQIGNPEQYGRLGGKSATYSVQRLLLDPEENGGPAKTDELARMLRERIVDGDDMSELVRRYSVDKENDGMSRDLDASQMKRMFPALDAFARNARPGDVSQPMFHGSRGEFVQIVRLMDRTEAVRPELSSPEVQKALTEAVQEDLDGHRLARAYQALYAAAYVWPPEYKQPARP